MLVESHRKDAFDNDVIGRIGEAEAHTRMPAKLSVFPEVKIKGRKDIILLFSKGMRIV